MFALCRETGVPVFGWDHRQLIPRYGNVNEQYLQIFKLDQQKTHKHSEETPKFYTLEQEPASSDDRAWPKPTELL